MASSSSALELTLGLKLSYVPKSLPNLFKDLSENDNVEMKLLVLNDYLLKHQEELIVVRSLRHELPQCKLLLMDAIERLKEEIEKIRMGEEPLSKMIPGDVSAPNKRGLEQEGWTGLDNNDRRQKSDTSPTQTAQEFSLSLDPSPIGQHVPPKKRSLGDMNFSLSDRLLNCMEHPLTQSTWKNNRRSWNPELHERFLLVLEYLGGPQVATPKQIRDLMQVEGLTSNQVKSHLQKFRMQSRRASDTVERQPQKEDK